MITTGDSDFYWPVPDPHPTPKVYPEHRPLIENPSGCYRSCYICGRDLAGLDKKYIQRKYRDYAIVNKTKEPQSLGIKVVRAYVISICSPCCQQFNYPTVYQDLT